MKRKEE